MVIRQLICGGFFDERNSRFSFMAIYWFGVVLGSSVSIILTILAFILIANVNSTLCIKIVEVVARLTGS